MALYTVTTGNTALAADLNQLVNLLNGSTVGTDVIVSSRIRAQLAGATAASGYVGGTTTGAPTGANPFVAGDFAVAQDGVIWVCTVAGSPGTWVRAGVVIDTSAADIANLAAAAAAGSTGKAADAGHVHSYAGLAVLANANTFSALQTFNQGVAITGGVTVTHNAADNVPTLPSANGARIWIQSTDPGVAANDGDLWVHG